jgi:phosphate-selective porin OprO/OprP
VNGAADGGSIDADTNDGKDVVARVFATPFAKSGPKVLRELGVGIATSTGRQNGAALPSLKSTGGQASFFSYASSASAAGRRLRFTPQLYYYNGPFGLLAEYVESSQQIAGSGRSANISNHAWQVAGSWVLTGERKSYKGVTPNKSLEGGKNGTGLGAWEVAARYTGLDVDPTVFALKFADSAKAAKAARAWAVGLNWYPIRNARLSFDFEQTHFQGGAAQGNRPTEKALLNRLQVTF